MCIWCRVGGVGARSRKRGGLGYRLVGKHARTEMLGLPKSMFLGLGYMSMCPKIINTRPGKGSSQLLTTSPLQSKTYRRNYIYA